MLEKKARWVTAKMYERIDSGEFNKLSGEALKQIRSEAGKQANKVSIVSRQTKAQQRQRQVKQLHDDGCSVNEIVGRLGIPKRTVYNDIKTFAFILSCTHYLFASLDHHAYSITTVKATATSKVCRMVWLLYGLVNGTSPQSPTTAQTIILKIGLFIHTVLVNGKNRTFIHTVW